MNDKSEIIINEIKELLKRKIPSFSGLYFFGSRTKLTEKKESDYDIAVLLDEEVTWERKDEIRNLVYEIMLQADVIIDVHVYSVKDLAAPSTPFRNKIKSEGIFYGV